MSCDDDWPNNTMENRREVVRKTIRPSTFEELNQLGAQRFPIATDPWCKRFNVFLAEHRNGKFYLEKTPEGAEIACCRNAEHGIWFLPGKGMGIIQPKGLEMLKQIVVAR